MPPPLQVLATGCVIIAAKALWLNSITKEPEIRASSEHYIQSQTPELVKIAIMGAFQGVAGHYNTPWSRMVLQLIVLNNQI
ncbi:hypothetical protein BOTBODRAFT_474721 [Botryobasidium botryosum FD-172 SS1]|uniref:Uncharacterized protein n=1 Tax=Botryobasidium botryosum (strain FD-172 SS1) TaxID=930990 RepID=A0A067MH32_BOTB1|nr:hypothetical protein BOTBODRAFT_474721 [Botryobasidium botryosum FD-172 SS1]